MCVTSSLSSLPSQQMRNISAYMRPSHTHRTGGYINVSLSRYPRVVNSCCVFSGCRTKGIKPSNSFFSESVLNTWKFLSQRWRDAQEHFNQSEQQSLHVYSFYFVVFMTFSTMATTGSFSILHLSLISMFCCIVVVLFLILLWYVERMD